MKVVSYSAKSFLLAALATVICIFSLPAYGQNIRPAGDGQFNLLVLGDSISWGQGLRDEHKAWYQVKTWVETTVGRKVSERIEAHSGAVIGSVGDSGAVPLVTLDGEVSRGVPSVNGQIDNALRSYADPTNVDLVLVDGCINDLDARRLLNAANAPAGIVELAQQKCGPPVEALLTRIAASFPNAHIIITGYYPILSEQTANDFFMRALAKRLYTGSESMNDKQLRARLIEISRVWYQASNRMLAAATEKVDAELAAKGSRQRAAFAEIVFLPEHSFAAPHSRLWGFDASAIRKLLVILTLGRVTLKTNDERRNQRGTSCKQAIRPAAPETRAQKKAREARLLQCRLAAIGHPNRGGALLYYEAISRQLKLLIDGPGWLRDTGLIVAPGKVR
ncbi:MAG TPA: SGNH/GDSL hydrolase family protein [Pyrinomonadaceae bacterium]|nr:SGNH/GDSL hydrolase family protein [Pyrinomonadaceae bacterium]